MESLHDLIMAVFRAIELAEELGHREGAQAAGGVFMARDEEIDAIAGDLARTRYYISEAFNCLSNDLQIFANWHAKVDAFGLIASEDSVVVNKRTEEPYAPVSWGDVCDLATWMSPEKETLDWVAETKKMLYEPKCPNCNCSTDDVTPREEYEVGEPEGC